MNDSMAVRSCIVAFLVAINLVATATPPFALRASAQDQNLAGLVIAHGDGSIVAQCVAFEEESISGAELLVRSGLDLSIEANSIGATICRIDGEGCDYPADGCFCQCQGSPCIYWSYWRLDGEQWVYSNAGAANTRVGDGDVDGWSWGPGTVEKAQEPPPYTFSELCAHEPSQVAPASELGDVQVGSAVQATAVVSASVTPAVPDMMPTQAAGVTQGLSPAAALGILFGVLIGLPVVVLGVAWMRHVRKERQP